MERQILLFNPVLVVAAAFYIEKGGSVGVSQHEGYSEYSVDELLFPRQNVIKIRPQPDECQNIILHLHLLG